LTVNPLGSQTLPTPTLNLPSYASVNGTLSVSYPPGYTNIGFQWTINAKSGPSLNNNPYTKGRVISRASSANFQTSSNVAGLSSLGLVPGVYTVTVEAVDANGNRSAQAQQDITLVAADFSGVRVFPNPWRKDRHAASNVTFDHLPLGTTVKIFTASGHWV
jgi:hypothetical protein